VACSEEFCLAGGLVQIFEAAKAPIQWEEHYVGTKVDPRTGSFLTWESMESVRRNGIGLKGPMTTPIGKGFKSLNLTLRTELGLYANVRPCLSIPGYRTRYDNVDLVTIRENTEGEYSGLEHQVSLGHHKFANEVCSSFSFVISSLETVY
jgi:isocitrate dehydrogenase (NAD+)